jgi:hypothetical protein
VNVLNVTFKNIKVINSILYTFYHNEFFSELEGTLKSLCLIYIKKFHFKFIIISYYIKEMIFFSYYVQECNVISYHQLGGKELNNEENNSLISEFLPIGPP